MQLQFSDSHFFSTLFFVKLHHIALISVPSKLHDHAAALTKDMYTKKRIMLCKKVVHCTYKKTATFIFKFTYLCAIKGRRKTDNYMNLFSRFFFSYENCRLYFYNLTLRRTLQTREKYKLNILHTTLEWTLNMTSTLSSAYLCYFAGCW